MFLKELPVGSKGKIIGFGKEHPEYRRRLVMLEQLPAPLSKWSASPLWATQSKSVYAAASSAFDATKRC